MISKVLGKIIKYKYKVVIDTEEVIDDSTGFVKNLYNAEPYVKREIEDIEYEEILSFDGEPHYNSNYFWSGKYMNISKDEKIKIEEEIFRADLNEMHLISDKVLKEYHNNKEESEELRAIKVKDFNEQMIMSNEKMHSYCKLHNLNIRETNPFELFKLIYGDSYKYEICKGEMKAVKKDLDSCFVLNKYVNVDKSYTNLDLMAAQYGSTKPIDYINEVITSV